jgi:hypothetical protein
MRPFSEPDVILLCAALNENVILTEFVASGRALTARGLQAVAEMLTQNSSITRLAVGDATLGDSGLAVLVPGLVGHRAFKWLDLSYVLRSCVLAPPPLPSLLPSDKTVAGWKVHQASYIVVALLLDAVLREHFHHLSGGKFQQVADIVTLTLTLQVQGA